MKNFSAMGLAVILLAGCASWRDSSPTPAATPAPAPVATATPGLAGKWLMVSCYVNARGCRGEAVFASQEDCIRARKTYDREATDRQAACKRADEE